MSTETSEQPLTGGPGHATGGPAAGDATAHEHRHPSDWDYVKIAIILGVITAAEVATYFWEDASTTALVATLFPMMIAKFAIVTGYFMHLKYDSKLFRRVFIAGLVLAVGVYIAAMATFEFWSGQYSSN